MKRLFALIAWAMLLAAGAPAQAHKPSDSYLNLRVTADGVAGQWDIALRDLDYALELDTDGDGLLTWHEVRVRHAEIAAYALSRLSIAMGGNDCEVASAPQLLDRHSDGAYTVLRLTVHCPQAGARLVVGYRLFADVDPQHKGLLRVEGANGASMSAVLGSDAPQATFDLARSGAADTLWTYVRHGVWHIWIGFDHILFLVSLLLPAVLVWRDGGWRGAGRFRPALLDVIKVVTAFTIAHSITLAAAALGMLALPARWVESAIAASVVLAALNNIKPLRAVPRWGAAFVFGLIHGFGFASVLSDLGMAGDTLALSLIGFNVGVELGQMAIVAVFLPAAFLLRHTVFYRRVVLVGGSLCIAGLAAVWLAERSLDLTLLAAL